jgi:cytosine deaminase
LTFGVSSDLVLREARLADNEPLLDICIVGGRIAAIGPQLGGAAAERELACAGRAVLPGLVEPHLHLDKALLADRLPNRSGTLAEALRVTAELKSTFTVEDLRDRAERALMMSVKHGVTSIRAETEFDPVIGLTGIRAVSEIKRRFAWAVDVQVVAFPQEGIFKTPGTADLFWEAMRLGADVVGGVPYNDL